MLTKSGKTAARRAGTATGTAISAGGSAGGAAAQRAGGALVRAGQVIEQRSTAAAPGVGAVVGDVVEVVLDRAVAPAVGTLGSLAGAVGEFLEEPAVRGGAALDALRGVPVGPPAAVRRWPWAVVAALGGAAAGAAVALLVHRVQRPDPPGAQEPHELRAVVDLPHEHAAAGGAAAAGDLAGRSAASAPLSPPA